MLDGVDGVTRHRFGQRVRNLAEFCAKGIDGFLDAGFAQRLDLIGDRALGQMTRKQLADLAAELDTMIVKKPVRKFRFNEE